MARTATMDEQDLERALLRKSVGALEDARPVCADCGRTPLIGETVHRFPRGITVCELCRPLRRGEPQDSARVRHSEAGLAVRVHRVPRS
jgi:ribosomal protein L37AE/L43A